MEDSRRTGIMGFCQIRSCQSYSLKWGSVEKLQTMNLLPVVDNLLKDLSLELNSERDNTLKSKIYEPS